MGAVAFSPGADRLPEPAVDIFPCSRSHHLPTERLNFLLPPVLKRAAWLCCGRGVFHNGLKVGGGSRERALSLESERLAGEEVGP